MRWRTPRGDWREGPGREPGGPDGSSARRDDGTSYEERWGAEHAPRERFDEWRERETRPGRFRGHEDERNERAYRERTYRGGEPGPYWEDPFASGRVSPQDRERGPWRPAPARGDRASGWDEERGPFAGRGPRGYRRSDARVKEEVSDRLAEHPWIDASDIEVEVQDCLVTLAGSVADRRSKRLAEDVAESVPGVLDVANHIRVRRDEPGMRREVETGGTSTG
jgi:hypothetical protein